jgi:phospholipase C
MSFKLQHILVSERMEPQTHESGDEVFFTIAHHARFSILYPGRLLRSVTASVRHSTRIDPVHTPDGGPIHGVPQPLHNGVQVVRERIPLEVRLFDPDGEEFTRDEVTLEDLRKFRDLRGTPRGHWLCTVSGRSRTYRPSAAIHEAVSDPQGIIDLTLHETVRSESAPPLVGNAPLDGSRQEFRFDLLRVGTFVARVLQSSPSDQWNGSMRLLDPDGAQVASTTSKELTCEIAPSHLGKSRDAAGSARVWTLQVAPQGGVVVGVPRIHATVIGSGRIGTRVIKDRIDKMIGPGGSFIKLVGENSEGNARARLTITDVVAAETIDMWPLLDTPLKRAQETTDLEADKAFTLFTDSESLGHGLRLDVSTLKLESLEVVVGRGRQLGRDVPAVRLTIAASGKVRLEFGPLTLADARLRDGAVAMEVGITIDPDGTPRVVTAVPNSPFDIDINDAAVAALAVSLGGVGVIAGVSIAEFVEHEINEKISKGARSMFDDPVLAPTILMTIFGAHLSYQSIRFDGDEIVFDYIAPLEPDLKPRRNYAGAIGRPFRMTEAAGVVQFTPRMLGDTWASTNLRGKIRHIVYVMMENRSYDHVLGYRALDSHNDGSDGLTPTVVDFIQGPNDAHIVKPLNKAAFPKNAAEKMTRLPAWVGHELDDVREQLSLQIPGPEGRPINGPKGFVDNFKKKNELVEGEEHRDKVVPDDVLGFYEAADLPVFAYLASNYAYCDRYYCSHPGPTLPNRMYSLTGDVQYDRLGVPILDNNHADNFLLSRAETIFDLLTKRGISWRIYESNPSVAMLRMFARYATNDTDIVSIDRLERDIVDGNLPAFTCVEPRMHSHPQDDDHPDKDMWRGQIFIKRVYDALRSNSEIWRNTLLIITYDEHGGFYDHVVPPLADLLNNLGGPGGTVGNDLTVSAEVDDGDGASNGGVRNPFGNVAVNPDNVNEVEVNPDRPTPALPDSIVKIPYGVRVPTFVVSPWTMRGKGPSITLDHCSILKTVLACFGGDEKPFLSDRVRASQSFESFLTEAEPRMDVEASPDLIKLPITVPLLLPGASQIVTPPLMRKQMREGPVEFHDLSGRLARMLGR